MAPIPSRAEITQAIWSMRSHFAAVSMAVKSYKKMYGDKETSSNISIMSLRLETW